MENECDHLAKECFDKRLFAQFIEKWKYCPICGASRPVEKKGLADIISDSYVDNVHHSGDPKTWNQVASAAIKWFEELVDELPVERSLTKSYVSKEELKAKLRESK